MQLTKQNYLRNRNHTINAGHIPFAFDEKRNPAAAQNIASVQNNPQPCAMKTFVSRRFQK